MPLKWASFDTCLVCAGGVELAFMSATPSREVAMGYAGAELVEAGEEATKDLPTLYIIGVGKAAIGARIEDVSQFQSEVEYVYPPLTLLEPVNEPQLSLDGKLSVVHLKITVNQRSTTVEDAEQDRRRFLTRLANSLQWDAKHWARKHQGLVPRLHDQIVGAARLLLDEVRDAELPVLNSNSGYGRMFERLMDGWEKEVLLMVEGLREDGEAAKRAGDLATAGRRFEQAIDAVRQPCADGKAARDHVIAMRRVLLELDGADCRQNRRQTASVAGVPRNLYFNDVRNKDHHGQAQNAEGLRILQVAAHKVDLATDLKKQGRYEEALQLFQETCAMLTDKDGVAWT